MGAISLILVLIAVDFFANDAKAVKTIISTIKKLFSNKKEQ